MAGMGPPWGQSGHSPIGSRLWLGPGAAWAVLPYKFSVVSTGARSGEGVVESVPCFSLRWQWDLPRCHPGKYLLLKK